MDEGNVLPVTQRPAQPKKESWSAWIERHKTILSFSFSILSLLIMVIVLTSLNASHHKDDKDATDLELERFAARLTPKKKPDVVWEKIAGLKETKQSLQEAALWPLLKPELFTGLREAHRGILLYGPPGTGKTLLVKALATASKSTFMVVPVSSITNKFVGESEKRMSLLFKAAALKAPTIIFMDEIEALTGTRGGRDSSGAMDRVLSEFLTSMDGLNSDPGKRILVVGATNTPDLVDEAVIRRLPRRIKVPLPDVESRTQQIKLEVENGKMKLTEEEYQKIAAECDGYSGSDLSALAKEAALVALREACDRAGGNVESVKKEDVRDVSKADFDVARTRVTPSVGQTSLKRIEMWEKAQERKSPISKNIPNVDGSNQQQPIFDPSNSNQPQQPPNNQPPPPNT